MKRHLWIALCAAALIFSSCGLKKELEKLNERLSALQQRLDRLDQNAKQALEKFAGKLDNLLNVLRAMPENFKGMGQDLIKKAKDEFIMAFLLLRSMAGVSMEDIAAKIGPKLISSLGNLSDQELASLGGKFSKLFENSPIAKDLRQMASGLKSIFPEVQSLLSRADEALGGSKSTGGFKLSPPRTFGRNSVQQDLSDQIVDLRQIKIPRQTRQRQNIWDGRNAPKGAH